MNTRIPSAAGAVQYALINLSGLVDSNGASLESRVWSMQEYATVYSVDIRLAVLAPVVEYWGVGKQLPTKFEAEIIDALSRFHQAHSSNNLSALAGVCSRDLALVIAGLTVDTMAKVCRRIRAHKPIEAGAINKYTSILTALDGNPALRDPVAWGALDEAHVYEWNLRTQLRRQNIE